MAVPAQVQARADKADELLKQASSEKPAEGNPPKPEDRDVKPPAQETVEGLKQQLATLQGKYNAEIQTLKDDVNLLNNLKHQVRTLTGQLQEANGKLNEANGLIGDLQKQITEKAQPADDGKTVLSALSEEDQEYLRGEGFDEKIVGIIAKALSKKEPAASRQNDEVTQLKKDMEQQKVKTFWKELADKVPDWEPINTSDAFNDWLDARLPYSDKSRRDALQGAQAVLDYTTAIQIFNDFKSANPAYANKPPEHRIDPAKQIEPASSVVHQPPADGQERPAGKTYTRQEISAFYKDYALAAAKGKITEDMKKTDADILLANKEGRIQ